MINDAFQLYYSTHLIQKSVQLLNAMLLQTGDVFTALIKDIPAPQTYLLEVNQMTFPLEIPMDLKKGDRITLRVRDHAPDRVVVDVALSRSLSRPEAAPTATLDAPDASTTAPRSVSIHEGINRMDAAGLLQRLSLPATEENIQAVHQLIRFEAPVHRDTIQTMVRTAQAHASRFPELTPAQLTERIAFAISRELEPLPETIRVLSSTTRNVPPLPADLSLPPAHPGEPMGRILQTVLSSLQKLQATAPALPATAEQLQQAVPTAPSASPLPPDTVELVRTALDQSPQLRALNRLIHDILTVRPELTGSAEETAVPRARSEPSQTSLPLEPRWAALPPELLEQLADRIPDLRQMRDLHDLTPEQGRRLVRELFTLEREEIRSHPLLRAVQDMVHSGPPVQGGLEPFQHLSATHMLNQLSALRDEGVYIMNIPVSVPGEAAQPSWVHVRVFTRSGRQRGSSTPGSFAIALNLTLSALGTVWVHASLAPPRVGIRFKVRNARLKTLFEKNSGDLSHTLQTMGYAPTILVDTAEASDPEPELLDLFERRPAGPWYSSIDIRI